MKKSSMRIALILSLSFVLVGCGVNKLPEYRDRISAVQLSPAVASRPELLFVSPGVTDPTNPDQVALAALEARVRERLAERLDLLAHPELVGDSFESALYTSFSQRLPWRLVEAGEAYDTIFAVDIERYGISVDADGVALLFFDVEIEGRWVETGTLIYEDSVRNEVPLTEMYRGHDDVSVAVARTMNLLALDELAAAEFQQQILFGADSAAWNLIEEMVDSTYE